MSASMFLPQKRKVEIFTFEMREDGILHLHAEGNHTVDMRLYRIMIDNIADMTGGKKVPMLSSADELTMPDEEVKEHMVNPDANPYALATALIAPSLPQKIFSKAYMRMIEADRPTRLFREEEEAIEWLRTFLNK